MLFILIGINQINESFQQPEIYFNSVFSEVSKDTYILGAGDSLLITVGNYATNIMSYPDVITPSGDILIRSINIIPLMNTNVNNLMTPYTVSGAVKIAGLTIPQAEEVLKRKLGKNISLVLIKPRLIRVLLSGYVKHTGYYVLTPLNSVSELISISGGFTIEGSRRNVYVIRHKDTFTLNLENILWRGRKKEDILLKEGDIVFVPKMKQSVIVEGAFYPPDYSSNMITQSADTLNKPQIHEAFFDFKRGDRLSQLLDRIGDLLPNSDIHNIEIVRGKKHIVVDLEKIRSGALKDVYLANNDRIIIPYISNFIYVTGDVGKGGVFKYVKGMQLNYYIARASGPRYSADLRNIKLIYPDGKVAKATPYTSLKPGTTIFVPRRSMYDMRDLIAFSASLLSFLNALILLGE